MGRIDRIRFGLALPCGARVLASGAGGPVSWNVGNAGRAMLWMMILGVLGLAVLAPVLRPVFWPVFRPVLSGTEPGGSRAGRRPLGTVDGVAGPGGTAPVRYSLSEDDDGLVLTLDPPQVRQGDPWTSPRAEGDGAIAGETLTAIATALARRGGWSFRPPEPELTMGPFTRPKGDPEPDASRATSGVSQSDTAEQAASVDAPADAGPDSPSRTSGRHLPTFDPARDRLTLELRAATVTPGMTPAQVLSHLTVTEAFGTTAIAFDELTCATLRADGPVWVAVEHDGRLLPEAVSAAGVAPLDSVAPACRVILV